MEQKRFAFKEDIRFYADDSKAHELMRLKARQRFDPRARYDVTASDGSKIGEIQKVFGESLLRSTYTLYDASGEEIAKARETQPRGGDHPPRDRPRARHRRVRRPAADPVPLRLRPRATP